MLTGLSELHQGKRRNKGQVTNHNPFHPFFLGEIGLNKLSQEGIIVSVREDSCGVNTIERILDRLLTRCFVISRFPKGR